MSAEYPISSSQNAAFVKPISLIDLALCVSDTIDLASRQLHGHHLRVAYLSVRLARECGFAEEDQQMVLVAGALHDAGALTLPERLDCLSFEDTYKGQHAHAGYRFLLYSRFFSFLAEVVRYHHEPWNHGEGRENEESAVPLLSHILHLADRIDVLIDPRMDILSQVSSVVEQIQARSGRLFHPRFVEAFVSLSSKPAFWFDLVVQDIPSQLKEQIDFESQRLDLERLVDFSRIISRIIDFRSHFTATHSYEVAVVSEWLGTRFGFGQNETKMLHISGLLHDLGKLAVPNEILEKNGPLTEAEMNAMKWHPYCTYHSLKRVFHSLPILEWTSFHHERLDGSGYPFRLADPDIPLGSQVLSVADVFTALAAHRPYRRGMRKDEIVVILENSVRNNKLNLNIGHFLIDNISEAMQLRDCSQVEAEREYSLFMASVVDMPETK